jgi:hypothetical protein
MKTFLIALMFGFMAGLGTAVHVTGFENLKSYIWGRYQIHLSRTSLKDIREIAQNRNYIDHFTAKIRGYETKQVQRFQSTRVVNQKSQEPKLKSKAQSQNKIKAKKALPKQSKLQKRPKSKQQR